MKALPNIRRKLREAFLDALTPIVGRVLHFFNGPPS